MSGGANHEARLHAASKLAGVVELAGAGDGAGAAGGADGKGASSGSRWSVTSPSPGWFRPAVRSGELIAAAAAGAPAICIGELEVLGQLHRLILPSGAGAVTLAPRFAERTRVAVAFGEELLTLDATAAFTGAAAASRSGAAAADATAGLVVRAPSSGRFYGRPGPQKPAFVSPGEIIEVGHTLCLLEVMKTFHRVTYDHPALPARARVLSVLVAEESDVVAGQPLVSVEPA